MTNEQAASNERTAQLAQFEKAALAKSLKKSRADYSLDAMTEFYSSLNVGNGPLDIRAVMDPSIAEGLERAKVGIKDGQISDSGIVRAMDMYAGVYYDILAKTTVNEFVGYVASRGYTDIPEKVKTLLDSYKDKTFGEVEKEATEKAQNRNEGDKADKVELAYKALTRLQEQVMQASVFADVVTNKTKRNLEAIASQLPDPQQPAERH